VAVDFEHYAADANGFSSPIDRFVRCDMREIALEIPGNLPRNVPLRFRRPRRACLSAASNRGKQNDAGGRADGNETAVRTLVWTVCRHGSHSVIPPVIGCGCLKRSAIGLREGKNVKKEHYPTSLILYTV
jgi:hypothetical protein